MIEPNVIATKLQDAFPDAEISIEDLTGTKDHYSVTVVSDKFEGKPLIKQHRLVYDALEEEMKGPIHALELETKTFAD